MTECIHGQEFESCSFGCTLKKGKLAIRAARLFTPKPWEHHWALEPPDDTPTACIGCGMSYWDWHNTADKSTVGCTYPTKLDINDWNVAMKLVRECDGDKVRDELVKIWAGRESIPVSIIKMWQAFSVWLIMRAIPDDYIEAAIRVKENENERT